MKKEDILEISRKENGNRDFVELEIVRQAGNHAARVGALVCCLVSILSSVIAHTILYSPWTIYFSITATQWLVRFIKLKRKTDLALAILFLLLTALALAGFIRRLLEVAV